MPKSSVNGQNTVKAALGAFFNHPGSSLCKPLTNHLSTQSFTQQKLQNKTPFAKPSTFQASGAFCHMPQNLQVGIFKGWKSLNLVGTPCRRYQITFQGIKEFRCNVVCTSQCLQWLCTIPALKFIKSRGCTKVYCSAWAPLIYLSGKWGEGLSCLLCQLDDKHENSDADLQDFKAYVQYYSEHSRKWKTTRSKVQKLFRFWVNM